jgi:magnesium-transporting ATPase (P-type)
MLILVVGDKSCIGKINAILRTQDAESTPLQQKLEHLARGIGKFGLIAALAILFVLLLRFVVEKGMDDWSWDNSKDFKEILDFFLIAVLILN